MQELKNQLTEDFKQLTQPGTLLSKLARFILLLQPFLAFPVFLSVLLQTPPIWLSWLIALIPWPLRLLLTRHLTRRTPFDIPILVSILGMLLGFFLSPDRQLGLQVFQTYLACILFYYGLVNNYSTKKWYWIFTAVFFCLVLISLSIWSFAGETGKHVVFNSWVFQLVSRLQLSLGTSVHANVLGGAFAVVIPGLVGITLSTQRTGIRWTAGILAVIFAAILVLSASSGGWIAAIVGVFIVFLFHRTKIFLYAFLAIAAVIGATFTLWHNASWVGTVFPASSIQGRLDIWQATISALKNQPITGLGLGGWWDNVTLSGYITPGGAHNAYLQFYSDTGIIGAVALAIAVAIGVRLLWRILHSDRDNRYYGIALGITAGIVAGGIHAIVDNNLNILIQTENEQIYFAIPLLWLFIACLYVSYQLLEGQDKTKSTIE